MLLVIVGWIWRKPVSTYAISVLTGGFGEFGEFEPLASKAIVRSNQGMARHESYIPGLSLCKPAGWTKRSPVDNTPAPSEYQTSSTGASSSTLASSTMTEWADKLEQTPGLSKKDIRALPPPRSSPKEQHCSRTRQWRLRQEHYRSAKQGSDNAVDRTELSSFKQQTKRDSWTAPTKRPRWHGSPNQMASQPMTSRTCSRRSQQIGYHSPYPYHEPTACPSAQAHETEAHSETV